MSDPQFIPADMNGQQLGSGVDPASDALMAALSQIRALQQQPLIPTDPFSQLGAGLSGIAAGYRGEVNPAVKQALAIREQQLHSGLGEAHLGLGIANLGLHTRAQNRLEEHDRTHTMLAMADKLVNTEGEASKAFGTQIYGQVFKGMGINVTPDVLEGIGQKPLKVDEINAIGKMLLAPDATVQGVASLFKVSPARVQLIKDIGNSPEARSAFGAKTQAQLDKEDLEAHIASMKNLKDSFDYQHPEVTKEVLAQTKMAFPDKYYQELSKDQQAEMVRRAESKVAAERRGFFDYQQEAIMDKALDPAKKAMYLDPKTYRPVSGKVTQNSADANKLVLVDNAADRRGVIATKTLDETVQRVKEIMQAHPEIWAKEVLNADGKPATMANLYNVGKGIATFKLRKDIDPDLIELNARMADIVKLATTAGLSSRMSNYVAGLEKESAGWMTGGTIEAKIRQLDTTRQRLNSGVMALGLDPLPTIRTLKDGTRVYKYATGD